MGVVLTAHFYLITLSLFGRNNDVCICRYEQLIVFGFIYFFFFLISQFEFKNFSQPLAVLPQLLFAEAALYIRALHLCIQVSVFSSKSHVPLHYKEALHVFSTSGLHT